MASLYVTESGATVRNQGDCLVVTLDEVVEGSKSAARRQRVLLSVPPHCLELVALLGRVHITSPAVLFCLDRGITVAWFTVNGSFRGRLMPAMAPLPTCDSCNTLPARNLRPASPANKAWSRPNCSTAWASWKTCSQTTPVKSASPQPSPRSRIMSIRAAQQQLRTTPGAGGDCGPHLL